MEKTTSSRWFNLISWGITLLIVLGLGGFAFWKTRSVSASSVSAPISTAAPTQASSQPVMAAKPAVSFYSLPAIDRDLKLITTIPQRPQYAIRNHTVLRGDSLYRISKEFNIKPETLLWANYEVLEDDPHSLKPGQELNIPPIDGLLYRWKDGDSLEKIASEYKAKLDDIVNWPGNNFDLADPQPSADQWVMIPGGWRESKAPSVDTGSVSASSCTVANSGFGWPAGETYLSGNDYFPGHYAIDIAAVEGAPIYAAGSGVVTKAAAGWNSGYGNYIVIDHCNGYTTLYAHLSVINVSAGMVVGRGAVIGASGNTGNSFGAHLHFEARLNGAYINPWGIFQ
jgi:murein DD-endopeptidase MepM/ murein hydrolase activator NlpD